MAAELTYHTHHTSYHAIFGCSFVAPTMLRHVSLLCGVGSCVVALLVLDRRAGTCLDVLLVLVLAYVDANPHHVATIIIVMWTLAEDLLVA